MSQITFLGSGGGGPGVFDYIQLPNTNAGATIGYISFGGTRWISDYGTNNTFVGGGSGNATLTVVDATDNVGIGTLALSGLTTGFGNVSVGSGSGVAMTIGSNNVLIGYEAGISLTVGGNNVAIGRLALAASTDSATNVAVGFESQTSNTTGDNNAALGYRSLRDLTTGSLNTGIGSNAAESITTESNNTAVGASSLLNAVGANNTAIGANAMMGGAGGVSNNTAVGYNALNAITSGDDNVVIGASTGTGITTGEANVIIGNNIAASNPSQTVAIGYQAAAFSSGDNNIVIGYAAGLALSTGDNNIIIGTAGDSADDDVIRIGTLGLQDTCFIQGIAGATVTNDDPVLVDTTTGQLGTISSSARFKDNIANLSSDLSSKIYDLRPVTFNFKIDKSKKQQVGLIAEEVQKVLPKFVKLDAKGLPNSVDYHRLPMLMLKEIQKLRNDFKNLYNEFEAFKKNIHKEI